MAAPWAATAPLTSFKHHTNFGRCTGRARSIPCSRRSRTVAQMQPQSNGGASGSRPPPPPQQQQQRQPQQELEQVIFTPDGRLPKPTKLSLVVKDALRRWYLETEKEALRSDVKAQALQGQMLIEGYGCEADPGRGRELAEKARRRGYRMQGVYCEI